MCRLHFLLILIVTPLADTSITSHLVSTPAFGSSGGMFQAMREILSWVPVTRTWSRGMRTANTSVASLTSKRFVLFVLRCLASTDVHDEQMSTYSGLTALDHANTKYSKGYATTGIVCTTCRHEFILPEGAGPLQKGERSVSEYMAFIYLA